MTDAGGGGESDSNHSPPGISPEAERARIEEARRMTPTEKLARVRELNRAEEQRRRARIRAEYGDISDEELRLRLAALRLPREMMIKMFGWDSVEKGW